MSRVKLATLLLGDRYVVEQMDDVELYASAAVWDWIQKPGGRQIVEQFGITTDKMYWTNGPMLPYSITVDVWTEVEEETEILLKLSGLTVNR